ncbi:MAG: MFS transporter [Gammaproteobacteria bacterium]|uniref:MFS transporter n=1 Tax=Pseudomaricurvus alcaniphilus TaxID=1166482 RepID=UPI00140E1A70|nr:MFS transporter [Pseudomaricurvus alcaniphilus]MBR9909324.1 MFS transporter [Gammaproteobacteria bacterium]NHN38260.1 MFS transporter [Pseudomaricurvus alcaniphilus]
MSPSNSKQEISSHAWYTLALLTLIYVCHAVDRSVISIVLEPLKQEFGISDSQVGILTGLAYATLYSLAGIPLGYLIDRVNRRNLLAVLVTVWSGCTLLCGLAQNYWHLLIARLAVGAAEAGGAPTALSIIGDLFPENRRSTAISIFWLSTAIGTAVSFAIGGLIAAKYGWRAAFFVAGLPGLLLVGLLFFTVREPTRGAMEKSGSDDNPDSEKDSAAPESSDAGKAPSLLQSFALIIDNKALLNIFIAVSLKSAVLSGVLVWAASFFIRVHDLSITVAGITVGLSIAIFGGLGSLLGGYLGDRVYRSGGLRALPLVPFASSIVTALFCALLALATHVYVAVIAFALFEVASRTHTAPGYSFLISNTPPRMRGVIISAMQIGSNLIGYGLGPFIVGVASDLHGGADSIRVGLLTLAGISLWAGLHFLAASRLSAARRLASEIATP